MKESKALRKHDQQAGSSTTLLMIESSFFERISAYMAENEWKEALEAEVNEIEGDGCHTPKFSLQFLKTFHTSTLKDSSRVDQTNSLLDNQPKLGFGNSQIQMDFQHLQ